MTEPDGRALADRWVDELVPEDLDWVELVKRYPVASILVAAAGGFYIGRNHGSAIFGAVGDLITGSLDATADRFVDFAVGNGESESDD
jgi:hypothetical protein